MYLKDKTDDELFTIFDNVINELNRRKIEEHEQALKELSEMD